MDEKIIPFIQRAADQGDAEAAMTLGECYMKGEGVEKNEEEALAWFRKAAELRSKGTAATEATPAPAFGSEPAPMEPVPTVAPQTTLIKKEDDANCG